MSDLLNSLIPRKYQTAHKNDSQDSFHSVEEEAPAAGIHSASHQIIQKPLQEQINPSTAPNPPNPPLQSTSQTYDVDAFLNDPANLALLQPPIPNTSVSTAPVSKPATGHYISLLYQLCQAKNLTPEFSIDGPADRAIFTGQLAVGEVTVNLDGPVRSKKEARERLAEKALKPVKALATRPINAPALAPHLSAEEEAEKGKNWVGMLLEYHTRNLHPTLPPPIYTPASPTLQSHTCTLTFPSHPHLTFGSPTTGYSTKKLAQRAAAKEAVEYLIAEGVLGVDGYAAPRKNTYLTSSINTSNNSNTLKTNANGNGTPGRALTLHAPKPGEIYTFTLSHPHSTPHTQLLAEIVPMLSLPQPVWHLKPSSVAAPGLLSGWVEFPGLPTGREARTGMGERMGEGKGNGNGGGERGGEVRDVFGKKAAREEMARGAWGWVVREVVGGRGGRVVVEGE